MTDVKSLGDPGIYKKNRHFVWYSEIKSRRFLVWLLVHGIETVICEMISLFFTIDIVACHRNLALLGYVTYFFISVG